MLLAGITPGPAVLSCSSIDCENATGWTRARARLRAGVCWYLALRLLWCERAVKSWANEQILAKLVSKRWRVATKFQGEENLLKVCIGLPLVLAARWDTQAQQQFILPGSRAVWPLLAQQGLRWEMGFGLPIPGLAEQHQSVSVMTWGCHATAAVMFVPGLALSIL